MLKVIIADDEKLICCLVQVLGDWEELDMTVAGLAENGLEALELIRLEMPDILITDIRMPGCDGLELIKRARKLRPELEIVIISGYAHFEYAQSAIRFGVGNYLLKPIKKEELMETLRKMKARCESRIREGDREESRYRQEKEDLRRLRGSLVEELLSAAPPLLTEGMLRDTYYFKAQAGYYQVFLVKIDCDLRETGQAAVDIVKEKAAEIFRGSLKGICAETLFHFKACTGYGILNFLAEEREAVRKCLRLCFGQLEAGRSLFGPVRFSLALGPAVAEPADILRSLKQAEAALDERLMEGTGRFLEHVPKKSGLPGKELLERYRKAVEHAIEVMEPEEAAAAADQLQQAVMGQSGLTGRELLELILAAGRFFIARMAYGNVDEIRTEFDFRCCQCGSGEELLSELKNMQKEIMQALAGQRRNEAIRPIRIAKQYVMQHFHEPITLEEVCEAAGFSVSYFSALFKKETGEGFVKYLTRVRMEEAKTLLRETNLSVLEICEKVGYSDRKHFTHTFHRATGLNPAEYRRLYG